MHRSRQCKYHDVAASFSFARGTAKNILPLRILRTSQYNLPRFVYALVAASLLATNASAQSTSAPVLPELVQLNSSAIKPEGGFSGVVGAAFLPNGTIVVADAGRRSIHRFDTSGKYLGSTGREGQGPGEFVDLLSMGACSDGTLLAFDFALNRISMFDIKGVYVRAITPPQWFSIGSVLSCDSTANVVTFQDQPQTRPRQRGAVQRYPAVVTTGSLFRNEIDTLAVLSGTDYYIGGQVPAFVDLPLGARALASSSGGMVAVGVTSEPHILVFRAGSRRADTLRVSSVVRSATSNDWQKAVRDRLDREPLQEVRQRLQAALSEAKSPRNLPLFTDLFVDGFNGTVWVRSYSREKYAEWRRLGTAPQGSARFSLPANVEVFDISKSALLGLQRNDDGTEEVIVFGFKR